MTEKKPPIPLEEQARRQREIISKAMSGITLPKLAATVVTGRYHGCGYEYSPTIWIHTEGHGPDLSQTESQGPDFNLDIIAVGQLPSVNYGDRAEAEKAQAGKVARVVAMVDRANAYTKLVEDEAASDKAMVEALDRLNNMANYGKLPALLKKEVQAIADALSQRALRSRALLRELWEAS